MNGKALTGALIVLLFSSSVMGFSQAQTSHNVSASTGEVDIAMGIKVKLTYDATVMVSLPSSAQPKDVKSLDVALSGGELTFSVYIPRPVDKWYDISEPVPVGSSYSLPVMSGVTATVQIGASTPLNVDGSAFPSVDSLTWNGEGTRSATLAVWDTAYAGEQITVYMPFTFDINVGLSIGFLLFNYDVASMDLGYFNASPAVSEVMTVNVPINLTLIALIAGAVVTVVAVAVGTSLLIHRKKKPFVNQFPYPPPPPPP